MRHSGPTLVVRKSLGRLFGKASGKRWSENDRCYGASPRQKSSVLRGVGHVTAVSAVAEIASQERRL